MWWQRCILLLAGVVAAMYTTLTPLCRILSPVIVALRRGDNGSWPAMLTFASPADRGSCERRVAVVTAAPVDSEASLQYSAQVESIAK